MCWGVFFFSFFSPIFFVGFRVRFLLQLSASGVSALVFSARGVGFRVPSEPVHEQPSILRKAWPHEAG